MSELSKLVRKVILELENVGPAAAVNIVEPLRAFVKPDVNVGKTDMTPHEVVEWYAGQILSIVDERQWFAMNSIINCVDKFCPETLP